MMFEEMVLSMTLAGTELMATGFSRIRTGREVPDTTTSLRVSSFRAGSVSICRTAVPAGGHRWARMQTGNKRSSESKYFIRKIKKLDQSNKFILIAKTYL